MGLGFFYLCPAGAADSARLRPPFDERDQAYCETFFTASARGDERFVDLDPLHTFLPRLVDYVDRSEKTFDSLSRPERLKLLAQVRFADVVQFVRDRLDTPARLTLYATYEAYLSSLWLQTAYYVRTENPDFYREDDGYLPTTFEDFRARRVADLQKEFLNDVNLDTVLTRLHSWLPRGRRERFAALRELQEHAPLASVLGDLVLGGDPLRALRLEVENEPADDLSPLGIGTHRERIYPGYADLSALWSVLKPVNGQSMIDLSAGIGRVGLSLAALGHRVAYLGYDPIASRVDEAARMGRELQLKPSDWRVDRIDLTDPSFQLPQADYYYLGNTFYPSDLARVMAKLEKVAQAGRPFRVVMAFEPLFAEAADEWPKEYPQWGRIFPKLPPWLEVERSLHFSDGEDDTWFFILKANAP